MFFISGGLVLADCPSSDLSGDCIVNLVDLAQMASDWTVEGIMPYLDLTLVLSAAAIGTMMRAIAHLPIATMPCHRVRATA